MTANGNITQYKSTPRRCQTNTERPNEAPSEISDPKMMPVPNRMIVRQSISAASLQRSVNSRSPTRSATGTAGRSEHGDDALVERAEHVVDRRDAEEDRHRHAEQTADRDRHRLADPQGDHAEQHGRQAEILGYSTNGV